MILMLPPAVLSDRVDNPGACMPFAETVFFSASSFAFLIASRSFFFSAGDILSWDIVGAGDVGLDGTAEEVGADEGAADAEAVEGVSEATTPADATESIPPVEVVLLSSDPQAVIR
ncbi:hypothetical protein [Actinoplanes sp. NPDC026619]|uniref:hypothetical protein n=1 Tax=Actinoplanes sp. NPDC026619 TaxID=3155798 RepID=UPI0033EF365D